MTRAIDSGSLTRPELVQSFLELTSSDVPRGLSTPILARIVAYETQAARKGGLPARLQRQLRSIAADQPAAPPIPSLRTGSRLIREWNGVTHVVDVAPRGFVYRGRTYRSLSAIAREITGARWSGPRFFGLTSGT